MLSMNSFEKSFKWVDYVIMVQKRIPEIRFLYFISVQLHKEFPFNLHSLQKSLSRISQLIVGPVKMCFRLNLKYSSKINGTLMLDALLKPGCIIDDCASKWTYSTY